MIVVIYFISDLHGDIEFRGIKRYLDVAKDDDLLIILGDIGINFEKTEENRKFTEYFLSIDKKIAIVDGNHENFDYLNHLPEESWNAGVVRRLTKNIVQLKRGHIFTIKGKTFFAFGGCKSSAKWKEMDLWYEGEEPTEDELNTAYNSLKENNYCVDYILTHKYEKGQGTVCPSLQKLVEFIEKNVQYNKWYSGHGHVNKKIDEKHILVYDNLEALS